MQRMKSIAVLLACIAAAPAALRAQANTLVLAPMGGTTVDVDGQITLSLMEIAVDGSMGASTAAFTPHSYWMINGENVQQFAADAQEGTFAPDMTLESATYTAPHKVPPTNPVAVSFVYQPSPESPATVTLVCNITVTDRKNFFHIVATDLPATQFELNPKYSSASTLAMVAHAVKAGPVTMVNVGAMEPNGGGGGATLHASATMIVNVMGASPGDFKWGVPPNMNTVQFMIGSASGMAMYSTIDCLPHGDVNCKIVPMEGNTRIVSFDPKTNLLGGEFNGKVVKLVNGKPSTYAFANGSFSTVLTGPGGPTP